MVENATFYEVIPKVLFVLLCTVLDNQPIPMVTNLRKKSAQTVGTVPIHLIHGNVVGNPIGPLD